MWKMHTVRWPIPSLMAVLLIHAVSAAANTEQWDITRLSIRCVVGKHSLPAKSEPLGLLQASEFFISNLFLSYSLHFVCSAQHCQTDHMQNVRRRFHFGLPSWIATGTSDSVSDVGDENSPCQGRRHASPLHSWPWADSARTLMSGFKPGMGAEPKFGLADPAGAQHSWHDTAARKLTPPGSALARMQQDWGEGHFAWLKGHCWGKSCKEAVGKFKQPKLPPPWAVGTHLKICSMKAMLFSYCMLA